MYSDNLLMCSDKRLFVQWQKYQEFINAAIILQPTMQLFLRMSQYWLWCVFPVTCTTIIIYVIDICHGSVAEIVIYLLVKKHTVDCIIVAIHLKKEKCGPKSK